jgi:hypothetical protein
MSRVRTIWILACAAQFAVPLLHAEPGPTFLPDATFKGSTLAGWHTLGSASWGAASGVITAKGGEGWLVLDKPYQDSALYTSFRCTRPCNAGILMRMEKRDTGSTGNMLAIEGEALVPYRVMIDADGKITNKTKLRNAGGQARYAPPPPPPGAARPSGAGRPPAAAPGTAGLPDTPPGVTLMPRPQQGLQPGWNQIEVLLDAEIIRAFLNDGGGEASAAAENMDEYGPMALYVGPGSEVSFKDVAWKNIAIKSQPDEVVGAGFRMQRINEFFYGWSAAAADFNHDGKLDIVSGPFIYYGPDFRQSSEIYPNEAYNTSTQYPAKDWIERAADFNHDGWPDVLTSGRGVGADLYINPQGEQRRWKHYHVVDSIFGEETIIRDIDGDGVPELIYTSGDGYISYAKPDPKDESAKWIIHHISVRGPWPPHGIGAGDINQDGRIDILDAEGWWEQPTAGPDSGPWKFHPVAFGRWARTSAGGCDMAVYDVNGDGLPDVVTTLESHGWGLAWFEQKRDKATGEISFVKHDVMGMHFDKNAGGVSFSQPHGTAMADVDGDGISDFLVGKRIFSHLDDFYDPDPYGLAVLYWYQTVRNPKAPGGAELIPHLIHNRSGAGSDILATDLNGDGRTDVVVATRSGTYIFWGKPKVTSPKTKSEK